MPKRCAIYARFSSEMQSPRSTGDQERECRAYAERQGWEIVLVDRDDAVRAGASAGRLAYQRLLEAAKAGKFDILLVEEVSRFSRDFLGGLAALGDLKRHGVQLADTKVGLFDLATSFGQLQAAFTLVTSESETQRLGERSKRGLKGKVIEKFSAGGQPAYGLTRSPVYSQTQVDVDGRPLRVGVRFEVHPVESLIVKRVFERYATGISKHAIAQLLNREGVPTRRAGGTRNGRPNSGAWCTSSIKAMLENEIYAGLRFWNKTSRKGEKLPRSGKKQQKDNDASEWVRVEQYVPRIVDEETWAAVQRRLKADKRNYERKHNANGTRQYLLSGCVRCAACSASFVIGAHRGKPPTPHYRCSFHAARGTSVCGNAVVVSQLGLEAKVKEFMEVIVKDPKELAALVSEHNRRISTANAGQLAVVKALEERRATLSGEIERLVAAIAQGKGSSKVLVATIEAKEKEVDDLAAKISEADALVQPLLLPRAAAVTDYVSGEATLFTGDFAHDRALIEKVIEKILVYADGTIVVQFHESSLFQPVRSAHARPGSTSKGALPARRSAALDEYRRQRAEIARVAGPQALESLEVDVTEDADGQPAFIMMTKGAAKRVAGPGKRADEIALASPGGFEPPLAT